MISKFLPALFAFNALLSAVNTISAIVGDGQAAGFPLAFAWLSSTLGWSLACVLWLMMRTRADGDQQ